MSEENNKFKTGDVVKLKSGSPAMTVESYTNNGNLNCVWFGNEKYNEYALHEDILEIATVSEPEK